MISYNFGLQPYTRKYQEKIIDNNSIDFLTIINAYLLYVTIHRALFSRLTHVFPFENDEFIQVMIFKILDHTISTV